MHASMQKLWPCRPLVLPLQANSAVWQGKGRDLSSVQMPLCLDCLSCGATASASAASHHVQTSDIRPLAMQLKSHELLLLQLCILLYRTPTTHRGVTMVLFSCKLRRLLWSKSRSYEGSWSEASNNDRPYSREIRCEGGNCTCWTDTHLRKYISRCQWKGAYSTCDICCKTALMSFGILGNFRS